MKFAEVWMGVNGSCLDMHYFGRCNTEGYQYKHGNMGTAQDVFVQKVLPRLKKAVVEYMAAQG
jgi:hypothetical protein